MALLETAEVTKMYQLRLSRNITDAHLSRLFHRFDIPMHDFSNWDVLNEHGMWRFPREAANDYARTELLRLFDITLPDQITLDIPSPKDEARYAAYDMGRRKLFQLVCALVDEYQYEGVVTGEFIVVMVARGGKLTVNEECLGVGEDSYISCNFEIGKLPYF